MNRLELLGQQTHDEVGSTSAVVVGRRSFDRQALRRNRRDARRGWAARTWVVETDLDGIPTLSNSREIVAIS